MTHLQGFKAARQVCGHFAFDMDVQDSQLLSLDGNDEFFRDGNKVDRDIEQPKHLILEM